MYGFVVVVDRGRREGISEACCRSRRMICGCGQQSGAWHMALCEDMAGVRLRPTFIAQLEILAPPHASLFYRSLLLSSRPPS
jgi:hypothetical protein